MDVILKELKHCTLVIQFNLIQFKDYIWKIPREVHKQT